jgi:hypothetical protein
MSHVTSIDIEIRDLDALESAVGELGAAFIHGRTTYNWYGRHVGDYPLPAGFTQDQLGKCEHAIRLPGVNYEIGVVKNPVKEGTFTLLFDFYGQSGAHDGEKLRKHFGDGLSRIKQMYGVHVAEKAARAKGWIVSRKLVGETIKLNCIA